MSGGTWQTQNKVRAGAYINFKAVNQDSWNPSDRNIVTLPVELSWGPDNEIIELTADQLTDGSCEKIIGYKATDDESLVIREALSNCYKALIYKINSEGGAKASYSQKDADGNVLYTMEAKYKGKCGNFVSYKVVENDADNTMFDLITYYRDNEKDKQTVSRLKSIRRLLENGDLKNNDYLSINVKDEQCKGTLVGVGFKIVCEANKKTLIGEEGNNLTIALEPKEENALLIIRDDEQKVLEFAIAYGKEFVASDLPENNYVVFLDETAGTIRTTQKEIDPIAFSQVHDARLKLEAGATLENGIDGKSTTQVAATGKWGGLTATSKLATERGNDLAFSIEKDVYANDANSIIPVIFEADVILVPSNLEDSEIINHIRVRNKDVKDTNEYMLNEAEVQKIIPQYSEDEYSTQWELVSVQRQTNHFVVTVKCGKVKDGTKVPHHCLVQLQGKRLIKNVATGETFDCSLIIKVAEVVAVTTKPTVKYEYHKIATCEGELEVKEQLEILTNHFFNHNSGSGIFDKTKWSVVSSLGHNNFTVEKVEETSDEKIINVTIKGTAGLAVEELLTLKLDTSVKAFVDSSGVEVTGANPVQAIVVEGTDGTEQQKIHLRCDTQDIATTYEGKSFVIDVELANAGKRYVFNTKARKNTAFEVRSVLGNECEITNVEMNADDNSKLKISVKYNGELPYNKNERFMIDTIENYMITDKLTGSEVLFVGYTLAATFYEPEPLEGFYKIVINDNGTNGQTVAKIRFIPHALSIPELVAGKYLENNYIEFGGSGELQLTDEAVQLSGGDSKADLYTSENGYFSQVKGERWNCMALPQENVPSKVKRLAVQLIKDLRENQGIKCQLVLENYAGNNCNYEGVISVKQGYKTADEVIPRHVFTATVAGLTAGASFNKSNTFKVLDGATEIIYYDNEKPYTNEDYLKKLKEGHFLLTKRRDLSIVCEKDQNTLHEPYPSNDVNYSFTKNRVIRTLDEINNTIVDIWESRFVGKVTNNEKGRTLYRTALINYINELERLEAVQNFNPQTDVTVEQGEKIDAVVVTLAIQPTDAMEKLYMTININ